MGTISDKLAKVADTKAALKTAINGTGATVGDVFADYPTAVSDGKAGIASAITAKGVTTPADATFATLKANVAKISTGKDPLFGTAVSSQRGSNLVLPADFRDGDYNGFFAYTAELNGSYNTVWAVFFSFSDNKFIMAGGDGVVDEADFTLDGAPGDYYVNSFSLTFGSNGTEYTCILF